MAKASKKALSDEQIIIAWSPALLRMELDRWLWRDQPHVTLKRVWECLTTYLYLSRLRDEDIFLRAIRDGLQSRDYFGYALSVADEGRYEGLPFGAATGSIYLDDQSVLVKPDAAAAQQARDREEETRGIQPTTPEVHEGATPPAETDIPTEPEQQEPGQPRLTRFHGSKDLDATRLGRDAGQIAEEVVQHLSLLEGANVRLTIEIEADMPDGAPDNVVWTVTENCRTLGFREFGFEEG